MRRRKAKFAHVCDNVQPLMLNDATDGLAWREHDVKKIPGTPEKQPHRRRLQGDDGIYQ